MRTVRIAAVLVPALLLACTSAPDTSFAPPPSPFTADSTGAGAGRLTVALLREAELRKRERGETAEDEITQALAPSRGDVFGFGGSMLGDVAAGLPGGAVLGFGGQMAGGNNLGKATGSTVGALLGAVFGPVGGIVGSMAGGFVGRQIHTAANAQRTAEPDFGPIYIDGMDTGPLRLAATDAS